MIARIVSISKFGGGGELKLGSFLFVPNIIQAKILFWSYHAC